VAQTEATKHRCTLNDRTTTIFLRSTWTTLFAFYVLFAQQVTQAGLCAGLLVAVLGAALQLPASIRGRLLRLNAPWGRLADHIVASVARDTIAVGRALVRASFGHLLHGLVQPRAGTVASVPAVALARRGAHGCRLRSVARSRPLWVAAGINRVSMPLFGAMTRLHSGIVGGYLAWITGGVALFAAMLGPGWTGV